MTSKASLLGIPLELREMIIEEVLRSQIIPDCPKCASWDNPTHPLRQTNSLGLLLTNRQLNEETAATIARLKDDLAFWLRLLIRRTHLYVTWTCIPYTFINLPAIPQLCVDFSKCACEGPDEPLDLEGHSPDQLATGALNQIDQILALSFDSHTKILPVTNGRGIQDLRLPHIIFDVNMPLNGYPPKAFGDALELGSAGQPSGNGFIHEALPRVDFIVYRSLFRQLNADGDATHFELDWQDTLVEMYVHGKKQGEKEFTIEWAVRSGPT